MSKYVIYHKFAGYLTNDDDYCEDSKAENVQRFDSREDAEIEAWGYLEYVKAIE